MASLTLAVLLLGALWTLTGPAQPGWNAIANGGRPAATPAGPSTSVPSTAHVPGDPFTQLFSAEVQGAVRQTAADAAGTSSLRVDAAVVGAVRGTVHLQATVSSVGFLEGASNTLVLKGPGSAPRYAGTIDDLSGGPMGWGVSATVQGPDGRTLTLDLELWSPATGQVTGTIQGTPH